MALICVHTVDTEDKGLSPKEYKFFLERVANYLHVPYFPLYISITLILEVGRIKTDYIAFVKPPDYSIAGLVELWASSWYLFIWPICMFMLYYSMRHLRNYTLYTLNQIRYRLKEYPTRALEKVFHSPFQHLVPICLIIISIFYFSYIWYHNTEFYFIPGTLAHDLPLLKLLHTIIWITYNWIIGGYFTWICIGTIIISFAVSKRVQHIDVFHHDRVGGLGRMGSLAMRTALLCVFSVSIMFLGWIVGILQFPESTSSVFLFGGLLSLGIIELALFLLPMMFFHEKMKQTKEKLLARLDALIVNFYDSLIKSVASEEDNKKFEKILTLRQMAESMHEYPFNLHMLVQVTSSVFFPYLILMIQKVGEFILSSISNK